MNLRHILCPVDFSDISALALRYAALIARCGKARLTVAYANSFSPPPYFTESRMADLERQFRESMREAESALREFVAKQLDAEAAAAADIRVIEAEPAGAIGRLASGTKADVIVMGTHGRTGVSRIMLGSVTERVLRESGIPVLTVRGNAAGELAPPKNILCPVNNTPAARRAIEAASELARCFGGNVIALHIKEGDRAREIGDLCGWLPEEARPHCTIRELSGGADAASEIVSLARETPCDLLVMGSQHRRFFDSTVLGVTTARVVRHAPCPVLTVPAA
jgi:nucleotide-binding universal stress UspA family protein